ncbi:MAG: HlyD family efflux transporter periplasmic adaptor subunit [Pseudomonadales bacterium]
MKLKWIFVSILSLYFTIASLVSSADTVTCLGRIEPLGGVILLAGPSGVSGAAAVIAELRVEEGDWVKQGQILAVLDDHALRKAEVARQKELVADASVRLKRLRSLSTTQSTSKAKLDEVHYEMRALQADQAIYEARQEMSLIRAPKRAQVLEVYTQPGEKVGAMGVLELGETDKMSVVAEVYETDISRIVVGQSATVSSAAFDAPAVGTVSYVGYKVGKLDALDIDPIARTDARVVEVIILVEDSVPLKRLTNLQVHVEIAL